MNKLDTVFTKLYVERKDRVYVYYGDKETGRAWGDIDVGYIGRSIGPQQVWLLIHNTRSIGGPAVGDPVVRVVTTKGRELYLHPKYDATDVEWNYCRGK